MATGILSKDTELFYDVSGTPTQVTDLQEIPDIGATPEQVEVTTLEDSSKRYIAGLKDYGELSFTFLYDNSGATSNYRVLKSIEGVIKDWELVLPDGTEFHFSGSPTVILGGAGVNAALTFTASITLNSDITVVDPA